MTDDAGIRPVNARHLGHDRPTDVISFRYDPLPGEGKSLQAEILINVERAWAEGGRRGDPSRELALYIAHGIDHLTGASDRTPALRRRMLDRENRWLDAALESKLLQPLFVEKANAKDPT